VAPQPQRANSSYIWCVWVVEFNLPVLAKPGISMMSAFARLVESHDYGALATAVRKCVSATSSRDDLGQTRWSRALTARRRMFRAATPSGVALPILTNSTRKGDIAARRPHSCRAGKQSLPAEQKTEAKPRHERAWHVGEEEQRAVLLMVMLEGLS